MNAIDALTKIKSEIEKAKLDKARLEGELDSAMQTLESFGVSSVDAANDLVDRLEKEEEELRASLEKQIDKLQSAYDWKTI